MSNEAYLENGPLHGKVLVLKDLLSRSLNGGIYMRDEKQVAIIEKHKIPWFTWVGAENRGVMLLIGDTREDVTVDSARLDPQGLIHLRLRKHAIAQELYQFWKETAEQRTPAWVSFQGQEYKGCADLVGKNDDDGYMFLHFAGKIVSNPMLALS